MQRQRNAYSFVVSEVDAKILHTLIHSFFYTQEYVIHTS